MNEEKRLTCRDLDELGDTSCCEACHQATATGHDRLNLIELDDGRMVRVCHTAFDALQEAGLLTTAETMDEPDHDE